MSRRRARRLELGDDELVVSRRELDRLHDDLFVLACAVDDTEQDLADAGEAVTVEQLRGMLDWLLGAARPLREAHVAASSPSES